MNDQRMEAAKEEQEACPHHAIGRQELEEKSESNHGHQSQGTQKHDQIRYDNNESLGQGSEACNQDIQEWGRIDE